MGRSSLALPSKHGEEEEVTALVQGSNEEAWSWGLEAEMGRSGQILGIFSLSWVYFHFSSLAPSVTACSPGCLDPHLSRTLFLLLLIVAPSAQGVTPSPEACQVFQSVNGTSANCYPPAKLPPNLPADTIYLSVEFSNLTQLSADILQGISNLQELHLSSNGLESLSAKFLLPVPKLKVLDLTRNALTRLPPGLFQSSAALRTLVLKENQLELLEASWLHGLKALGFLDLSGNRLRTLPPGLLANFTDLCVLNLGNNQLETLPPDLLRGPLKLEWLYLEGNRLQALPEGLLVPQPNLQYLFLNDNQLVTVAASAFQGLKQLDMLDLSNNSMTSVPKGLWTSLGWPGAGRDMKDGFDLSGNPWICDQNLDDLYQWLVDNKDKMFFRNNTCCAEPKAMKGKTLLATAMSHLKPEAEGKMGWNGLAEHCTQ